MFHCLPNVIETNKKTLNFFSPNLGHNGGGTPRWKVVTLSSFLATMGSSRSLVIRCLVRPSVDWSVGPSYTFVEKGLLEFQM